MTEVTIRHESAEFVKITLKRMGVALDLTDPIYGQVAVSVVPRYSDAGDFTQIAIIKDINGATGFMYGPTAIGAYLVFVQITAPPETPVLEAGTIFVE